MVRPPEAFYRHDHVRASNLLQVLDTAKGSAAPLARVLQKVLVASANRPLWITEGLSIVICCHNGASRLPVTLAHLKVEPPRNVAWEVLLIDNASTDDSARMALEGWSEGLVPLRVIGEPRLGFAKSAD